MRRTNIVRKAKEGIPKDWGSKDTSHLTVQTVQTVAELRETLQKGFCESGFVLTDHPTLWTCLMYRVLLCFFQCFSVLWRIVIRRCVWHLLLSFLCFTFLFNIALPSWAVEYRSLSRNGLLVVTVGVQLINHVLDNSLAKEHRSGWQRLDTAGGGVQVISHVRRGARSHSPEQQKKQFGLEMDINQMAGGTTLRFENKI